ncbi:MAG: TolC family protein [Acidiferrobacteraceae bacterium]
MRGSPAIRRVLSLFLGVCAATAVPTAGAAPALDLNAYYAAALKRSETVAIQGELVRQAQEKIRQAKAAVRPTIKGFAGYTWQQAPNVASSLPGALGYQPVSGLNLSQPLFSGFREFAALRQTKDLVGAQRDDYRNARRLLFNDVVQNFYTVLSLEQDLANLQEEIHQNELRAKDLRARVRIGRSRSSELLTVQTAISTLRAEVQQLRGQLRVARETFAFLSGMDANTPLQDSESLPGAVDGLDAYLAATESRADIQAAHQRLKAAQENVKVARGAYLPTLDLNGNYYTQRAGYLKDVTWDVQLTLSIPIYSGGGLRSATRDAISQRTQAELSLSQARRSAQQEIRSLHDSAGFDLQQLQALKTATEAARRNYDAQKKDYRLGLVTNLDVLQALTSYQENQRALDRARFTAKIDWMKLQAASDRLPILAGDGTAP